MNTQINISELMSNHPALSAVLGIVVAITLVFIIWIAVEYENKNNKIKK